MKLFVTCAFLLAASYAAAAPARRADSDDPFVKQIKKQQDDSHYLLDQKLVGRNPLGHLDRVIGNPKPPKENAKWAEPLGMYRDIIKKDGVPAMPKEGAYLGPPDKNMLPYNDKYPNSKREAEGLKKRGMQREKATQNYYKDKKPWYKKLIPCFGKSCISG